MDLERMFDLVCHMQESPHEDYTFDRRKGIVLNYKQQGYILQRSIQAFFQGVGVKEGEGKVIQAFSGSGDLPQLTKDVFNVVDQVPEYDIFWQNAFRGVPLRKGQLEWEIGDVTSGITFSLIPEGGRVKIFGISGTTTSVKIYKYGAGIGLSWEIIEGRKLYRFVELMEHVRSALYNLWADTHYGLIATAAASAVVAWQGAVGDPLLDRDAATINKGYETIGEACKDKGYGDTANMPMIMFAKPAMKSRLMAALRATSREMDAGRAVSVAGSAGNSPVIYPVNPYFTYSSQIANDTDVLMVLPRNKIQNSMYMQELALNERDIETLSELRTYWTAFGAVVGDSDQTAELNFV